MTNRLPLDGARILDLGDEATSDGPRLLADLGARVIRIEPLAGDPLRYRKPFIDGQPGLERSLAHLRYNAGKESVALALDRAEGWEIVDRLADVVDVVVAPLTKSARARDFFKRDRFEGVHPTTGLIDVVFRRAAPEQQATDLAGLAAGGLLLCHGYADRPPDHPAGAIGFKQTAFNVAAVAAAIVSQRRQGTAGARVVISLQEAVASTAIQADNQNYRSWGLPDARWRALGRTGGYPTADGHLVAVAPNPVAAETLPVWYEEATGRPCPHDIAFVPESSPGVGETIREICAVQPRDWVVARGQDLRHFVTPINSVTDIGGDTHLATRECFPEIAHPATGQNLRVIRPPFRSSTYEPRVSPGPCLGENTAAVLRDFAGIGAKEFGRLRATGIVAGPPDSSAAPPPIPAQATRSPLPDSRRPATQRDDLPLAGVRVLDFCWMAAGPLVTELLANLGADVVKVESASGIDRVRSSVLAPANPTFDLSAFFHDVNTDKRSLTLNLRRPEAVALLMDLLPHFDVVTSNFTPGTMEKWGLGYDALRRVRPDIIAATYPVMGENGPCRKWKGIGNGVVGLSGLTWHSGAPDRPPAGVGLHTDFTLAPIAATQIIAALLQRDRTGEGQLLEIAQYEAAIQLLDTELLDCLVNRVEAPRHGNRSFHHAPHGVFRCRGEDHWLAVGVRDEHEWVGLCTALRLNDWVDRADLRHLDGRQRMEDQIDRAIADWCADRDAWEAAALLQAHGVAAAAAQTMGDIVQHDAGMQDFFFTFDHEGVEVRVQHQPFTWNGARLPTRRSPCLGEHNEEILCDELGLSADRFADLVEQGVVV